MRKLSILLLISALLCSSFYCTAVSAADDISVEISGEKLDFTGDQPPVIIDGRTLVPFRAVFEKMGAVVNWYPDEKLCEASLGGNVCSIKIGSKTVSMGDGSAIEGDVPAQIINSRTMVPLRILSESLGAKVDWDPATKKVSITPDAPDITVSVDPTQDFQSIEIGFSDASLENKGKNISVNYSYPVITDKSGKISLESLNQLLKEDADLTAQSVIDASNEDMDDAVRCDVKQSENVLTVVYAAQSGVIETTLNYDILTGEHLADQNTTNQNISIVQNEPASYNYTMKEYGEGKTTSDGAEYIAIDIEYPEFEGAGNAQVNKELEDKAKTAGLQFIEKYDKDALSYYEGLSEKPAEAPFRYTLSCDVSFSANNAAVTFNHSEIYFKEDGKAPAEEKDSETVNVSLVS